MFLADTFRISVPHALVRGTGWLGIYLGIGFVIFLGLSIKIYLETKDEDGKRHINEIYQEMNILLVFMIFLYPIVLFNFIANTLGDLRKSKAG